MDANTGMPRAGRDSFLRAPLASCSALGGAAPERYASSSASISSPLSSSATSEPA